MPCLALPCTVCPCPTPFCPTPFCPTPSCPPLLQVRLQCKCTRDQRYATLTLQHWHADSISLLLCSDECAKHLSAFCLKVVYGLILGLVGCFICSLTRIWNNGFKRTTAVLFCGLAIMWLGLKLNYLGASSVGCLSLTVLVSTAWERGFPPRLCKGTPAVVCMLQTSTPACLLSMISLPGLSEPYSQSLCTSKHVQELIVIGIDFSVCSSKHTGMCKVVAAGL